MSAPKKNARAKATATGFASAREEKLAALENPGLNDQERGEARRNADGSVEWKNPITAVYQAAVYHEDIRQELIDVASRDGSLRYTYDRKEGRRPHDKTAYHPWQKDWSSERGLWPNIQHDILNRLEKRGYTGLTKKEELQNWVYKGRVIIDQDHHPLRWFPELPLTLSSALEGWEMEALQRLDPNVERNDIRARMPALNDKGKPTGGMSALGNKRQRFRMSEGLVAWEGRKGNQYIDAYFIQRLPAGCKENNTTRGATAPTKAELVQVGDLKKGRNVQAILGADFAKQRREKSGRKGTKASETNANLSANPLAGDFDGIYSHFVLGPKISIIDKAVNESSTEDGLDDEESELDLEFESDDESTAGTPLVDQTPSPVQDTLGGAQMANGPQPVEPQLTQLPVKGFLHDSETTTLDGNGISSELLVLDTPPASMASELIPATGKRARDANDAANKEHILRNWKKQHLDIGPEGAFENKTFASLALPSILPARGNIAQRYDGIGLTDNAHRFLVGQKPRVVQESGLLAPPLTLLRSSSNPAQAAGRLIHDSLAIPPSTLLEQQMPVTDFRAAVPSNDEEADEIQAALRLTRRRFRQIIAACGGDAVAPVTDRTQCYLDQCMVLVKAYVEGWCRANPEADLASCGPLPGLRVWEGGWEEWRVEEIVA